MIAHSHEIVIVGGGVIGLAIAYALARDGLAPRVLDRSELGRESSWAGAGLIPPDSREGGENPSVALRSYSARLYPAWSAALREETGIDVGYRRTGGVDVALTDPEDQLLRNAAGQWRAEGIEFERLAPGDITRVEPALQGEVRSAYFLPDRAQVRNPRLLRALLEAVSRRGGGLEPWNAVEGFEIQKGRVVAVRTGLRNVPCSSVVVAAGAWSGRLLEHLGLHAPTPPVKGQIVLLRGARRLLRRIVEHGKYYLVPRDDGRILVGATEEHAGFDTRPTARGARDLLDEALALCPVLEAAMVEATWAGLRPGSIDSKPYIGAAPGLENVVVATGHNRAGLQLAPGTAEIVADLVLGRTPRIDLTSFRPGREAEWGSEEAFRS
jgi:glycine oxidase